MNIFEYSDYKQFVVERVAQMPHKGRGQFRLMGLHLNLGSTVISQIFKGARDLTPEHGVKLCDFLGLAEIESKYFMTLLLKARAGTHELKNYYLKEEEKLKKEGQQIKSRITVHQEITEEHKALFYSDWIYSGIRMLSAVGKYNTVDDFAEYFRLPRSRVQQVVEFLLRTGLCVEENGIIKVGPQSTHLDNKSPLVNSHRKNWHLKAIEKMNGQNDDDLFYSAPMSLSREDRGIIREELVGVISKTLKRVHKSNEENVACLNIDWFEF